MDNKEIRETLEKQLQLLSERFEDKSLTTEELDHLTSAMVRVADVLLSP